MSNIVKSKFAGLLRGMFKRFDDYGTAVVTPPLLHGRRHISTRQSARRRAATQITIRFNIPSPATPDAGGNDLQLPLPSVIAVLPIDLRAKMAETPPTNAFISIPVERVLSQLAHGSVKISLGELRAARPGLFVNSCGENDTRQIALPLNEIITRISPTLLSRRAVKKVEAADDVDGPFGNHAQEVNFTANRVPAKAAPTLPPRAAAPLSNPASPKIATLAPAFVPKTPW